jgi:hypothetical protein
MNSTCLALVIGAFVVGCGGELPAQCPPATVDAGGGSNRRQ